MDENANGNVGSGNGNVGDEAAGSDIDIQASIAAMGQYGLDPTDAETARAYVKALQNDTAPRDPHSTPYQRAAQALATRRAHAAQIEKLDRMGVHGNALFEEIGKMAFGSSAKAQPLPEPPQMLSRFDVKSPRDMWDLASGKLVPDPNDKISGQAGALMDAAGVDIMTDDPEYQLVKTDASPEEFLESVKVAIEAKKRRVAPATPSAREMASNYKRAFGGQ